ncbi:structural maintenance of chromosome 3 (chondroitin sulfate proteoglycan 6) [Nematocida displodere]|uniref:Structural maintenance of chromosome 3 (Chondroitin sulfate proteoglycan 6) n=1 Tax=Nematocida displodere TaxID=1805483 RepID=A0A177EJX6_9MICR|nr:structural maintenance of chromosome 3 (chondroitin sulfate proteoglycan 6) [Nematocida displodere]
MKIKSLTLSNFKSFPGTVEIGPFSSEANVFIGKNGAGKSSILFAVRFVVDAHERYGPHERTGLVNENTPDLRAYAEIVFDNDNRAFPGGSVVTIRRAVTQKSDEYTVDGRGVSREEMVSLYEIAGLSKTMPYFVVEQGRIGELARMSSHARMGVIRELAGSTVYEKDKEEGRKVLEESRGLEEKTQTLISSIKKRVSIMEEEKARRRLREEAGKKKEVLVRELYKRELQKIKGKLEEIVSEDSAALDTTTEENEAAIRARLEQVLSQLPPTNPNPTPNPTPNPNHHSSTIPETREEIKRLERQKSAAREEIKHLEALCRGTEALASEINNLKLQGPSAVAKKLAELKQQAQHQAQQQAQHQASGPGFVAVKPEKPEHKEDVLEQRRELWRLEKETQKKKQDLEARLKEDERAFLMRCKGFALGSELRQIQGVLGYVYDIIAIPPEMLAALAATSVHLLMSVVVKDVEDAIRLVREHGIEQTVIPLSRAKAAKARKKLHTPIPSLSSYISCADEFADLIEYLFGSIYYLPDFESAKTASRTYGINVITAAGEYFSATGSISGGEEKASTGFRRYIATKEEYRECLSREKDVARLKEENETHYRALTRTKPYAHTLTLESMIFALENEDVDLSLLLLQRKAAYENTAALDGLYASLTAQEQAKEAAAAAENLQQLQELAASLEEKLALCAGTPQWQEKMEEKARLEAKFRRVQKKILSLNADTVDQVTLSPSQAVDLRTASKEQLIGALAVLKRQSSDLPPETGETEHIFTEYLKMTEKLKELNTAKTKIFEMQAALEAKKEEVIGLTVSQVKSNFEYFFHKVTRGTARMTSSDTHEHLEVEASFNGEPLVGVNELSGGQRTVVALCLILAVQKVYEAPFYLLDEFDANLDASVLSGIVQSGVLSGKQLLLCTFRGETLGLGQSFFHVRDSSEVKECSVDEAADLVCSFCPSHTPPTPRKPRKPRASPKRE